MSDSGVAATSQQALTLSYDNIPYDSQPFADARPAYLAGLGMLHGLRAANPSRCRVLELGCASGGHLVPLAWHFPDSHFVGVDLSPGQIATGRRLVEALQLRNCELHDADLSGFEVEAESFDFVIAHGLYSWVPASVRELILPLCRRALRRGGIAYVSYNTLPGWRSRSLVRDLLDWHLRSVDGSSERLAAAWAMLQKLGASIDSDNPGSYLEMEVKRILSRPPSYLAHEFLEPDNHALMLHEFAERAAAAGLRYLCNADLLTAHADYYDNIGTTIESLGNDPVAREQYLDFVANRAFRQSLLCRDDEPPTAFDPARAEQLYMVADLVPPQKLDLRRAKGQVFQSPDGADHEVHHPLTKAALAVLHEVYPAGVAYPALLREAVERVRARGDQRLAGEEDELFAELLGLVVMQQVEALPESPGAVAVANDERPRVGELARQQAALGWSHLATRTHRTLELDAFARELVEHLDGGMHRDELTRHMLAWVAAQRSLDEKGLRLMRGKVEANTRRLLRLFARHGILAGGDAAGR